MGLRGVDELRLEGKIGLCQESKMIQGCWLIRATGPSEGLLGRDTELYIVSLAVG